MLKKGALFVIALHLLIVIFHGVAHEVLHIRLSNNQYLFGLLVVTFAPLPAGVLIWKNRNRPGAFLLTLSMVGSFVFGFWNHFAVISPDHVSRVSNAIGPWSVIFIVTAYLLAFTEMAGSVIGAHLLFRRDPSAL